MWHPGNLFHSGVAQMQHQQMQQMQQMQHQQMQQMQHQQMQQMQQDPSQQMHHQQMQDQSGMVMGPTGPVMDPNQQNMVGGMGVPGGPRYGPQNAQMPPPHMRRPGVTRLDAHGQVIIETDENLSDKEIYPGQSMSQMGNGINYNHMMPPNRQCYRSNVPAGYNNIVNPTINPNVTYVGNDYACGDTVVQYMNITVPIMMTRLGSVVSNSVPVYPTVAPMNYYQPSPPIFQNRTNDLVIQDVTYAENGVHTNHNHQNVTTHYNGGRSISPVVQNNTSSENNKNVANGEASHHHGNSSIMVENMEPHEQNLVVDENHNDQEKLKNGVDNNDTVPPGCFYILISKNESDETNSTSVHEEEEVDNYLPQNPLLVENCVNPEMEHVKSHGNEVQIVQENVESEQNYQMCEYSTNDDVNKEEQCENDVKHQIGPESLESKSVHSIDENDPQNGVDNVENEHNVDNIQTTSRRPSLSRSKKYNDSYMINRGIINGRTGKFIQVEHKGVVYFYEVPPEADDVENNNHS